MESDPINVGKIISAQLLQSGVQAGTTETLSQEEALRIGQLLQARVASILAKGMVLLDINGQMYQASGMQGLIPGQSLTLRVGGVQPNFIFEVLSDNIPAEKNLAAAIKTLTTPALTNEKIWQNVLGDLSRLQSLGREIPRNISTSLISDLVRQMTPLEVGKNSAAIETQLKQFLNNVGFNLESDLRAALLQGSQSPDLSNVKSMISQLMAGLNTAVNDSSLMSGATPGIGQDVQLTARVLNQLVDILQFHRVRISRHLPVAARARLQVMFQEIEQNIKAFSNSRITSQQFQNFLSSMRENIMTLTRQVSADNRQALSGDLDRLIQDIESTLARDQAGKALLRGMILSDSLRSAEQLRDRLEAYQVYNANLGDKALQFHSFFPISIMNELTDVQIKQFLAESKSGSKKNMTVVMMIELQSLGKIRIDALTQEKVLYCHVFVEKPELVEFVESMAEEFGQQLESRGYKLGRLVCKLSVQKIEQFNNLQGDILDDDESLVDMKI